MKTVNKGAEWAWLSGEFVVALVVQVMSQPGMKEATNNEKAKAKTGFGKNSP